jgi:opacity protein-like surface antigen
MICGLIGIGGTKGDRSLDNLNGNNLDSLEESGKGFLFGAAVEFGLTDNFGLRAKMLNTKYNEGDTAELRIKDTSIMARLIIKF